MMTTALTLNRLPNNSNRQRIVRPRVAVRQPVQPIREAVREFNFVEPSLGSIKIHEIAKGALSLGVAFAALYIGCSITYQLAGAPLTAGFALVAALAIAHLLGPESKPQLG